MDIKLGETQLMRIVKNEFKGKEYVDIRKYFKPEDGNEYLPTKKGISIPIDLVEEVMSAVKKELV